VTLNIPADDQFNIGRALLTSVGEQLAPICGSEPVAEFFETVIELWKLSGYVPE
jgi:hypothetical protein